MLSSMPSQSMADQWPKVIDPGKKCLNLAVVNGEVNKANRVLFVLHIKPSYRTCETTVMHL